MRLIDADALKHEISTIMPSRIEVFLVVDKMPDAIVRCKDCVHWDGGHTEECDNSDRTCFHNGWCKPDWFCADGERAVK